MKLQIDGQKLRVRVDEEEFSQLLGGAAVEVRTHFADAFVIHFALRTTAAQEPGFDGRSNEWRICLPATDLHAHAARLPTRDGLRYRLAGKDGAAPLELLFDVDVRDSAKRRRSRTDP
ncbi:MAG: hypothetical protein ABI870_10745 [Rhodanobacter sp.]